MDLDTTIKRIKAHLHSRGLSLVRIPGTDPTWVCLNLPHNPTLSYRNDRWTATSTTLQTLIEHIVDEHHNQSQIRRPQNPARRRGNPKRIA